MPTSIAACLAAHSMNVGYRPIAKKGVPALERSRLSHVFQNYVRPETLAAASAPLVARQAGLPLAQAWGGGLVAAVDGMRFVVPVPAAFARPNRKYFGSKRGMTWLNAVNDHGMGRGAKIVSGTVRDSLHMVDVIFGLDGGELPEIVVSDPNPRVERRLLSTTEWMILEWPGLVSGTAAARVSRRARGSLAFLRVRGRGGRFLGSGCLWRRSGRGVVLACG
ncbi:MAG TPA: Tn3 family transposase [Streptosporangiaceae bacterium]|nr:Tn3 family transposase [Streptosporangiaceae bacterium]